MLQAPDHSAEGSQGVGECGHGIGGVGEGKGCPLPCPLCPWLSPFHPPVGLPHPWVLEKGLLVPAGAGQWGPSPFPALGGAGCSQAVSSSVLGWGF